MDAFVLGEIGDGLPLRAGQAEPSGALLEALAQKARGFMQQKAQRRMLVGHGELEGFAKLKRADRLIDNHKPAYYQQTYNKRDAFSQGRTSALQQVA